MPHNPSSRIASRSPCSCSGTRSPGASHASRPLPHERLDVFEVAIELVELVASIRAPRGSAPALEQLKRSSASVALNIGEACGKAQGSRDRARYFDIARGSALESAAALRVLLALRALSPERYQHGRALCERAYAMLTRLSGR